MDTITFMNLISIFIISFLIALSGALAPGPLLAVVIAETPRRGFKTGPLVIVGHGILETIRNRAKKCAQIYLEENGN